MTLLHSAAAVGEDEIDWDEDDKPEAEPAAASTVSATAAPTTIEPQPASESSKPEPSAPAAQTTGASEPTATAPSTEESKPDFSMGLEQSDAQKELEKRAARAKKFGIPENDETKKLAERAKKFGLESKLDDVVKVLDSALPERKLKRGREGGEGGNRANKRQTPDRRTEESGRGRANGGRRDRGRGGRDVPRGETSKISDDPAEKAKMEARAKKFGKPLAT